MRPPGHRYSYDEAGNLVGYTRDEEGVDLSATYTYDDDGNVVTAEEDTNGDGLIDGADLGALLAAWGSCSGCAADINKDGEVNGADMGLLLAAFGKCT